MALLVLDGFDSYDTAITGGANCLQSSGWVLGGDDSYSDYDLVPGASVGKALYLKGGYSTAANVRKHFSPTSSVVYGCSMAAGAYYPSGAYTRELITLSSADDSAQVYLAYYSGSRKYELWSDTSSDTVDSISSFAVGSWHYMEIAVDNDIAELFIDGVSQGTITIGAPGAEFSYLNLYVRQNSISASYYANFSFDDLYITDYSSTEFVGRLGPIALIPMQPTADGVVYDDFSVEPPGPKFSTVDDMANAGAGDDTDYVKGSSPGDGQTFTFTAEADFVEAIGYHMSVSSLTDLTSGMYLDCLVVDPDSTGEISVGGTLNSVGQMQSSNSLVQTTLPGDVPLTRANMEAAEFGFKLKRFVP